MGQYANELAAVNAQYPFEPLAFDDKLLILTFKEAKEMTQSHFEALLKAGKKEEVDKFPLAARPFYTTPDPYNPSVSNSYDFFLRGEEITSGAQRIHNTQKLIEQANKHAIPIPTIQSYIDSFKYATSPHAGCGIGLERVVMLFMGLDNVRKASMFPRDPQRCHP